MLNIKAKRMAELAYNIISVDSCIKKLKYIKVFKLSKRLWANGLPTYTHFEGTHKHKRLGEAK